MEARGNNGLGELSHQPIREKTIQSSSQPESSFPSNESVFPSDMKPVFTEAAHINQGVEEPVFINEMKPIFSEKPIPLNTMAT